MRPVPAAPGMKVCCRCKAEKPYGEFGKSKNRRDGHHPMCKPCRKVEAAGRCDKDRVTQAAYYEANREQLIAAEKARRDAWSLERIEAERERSHQYYLDHIEEHREWTREYRRTHKEEIKAQVKRHLEDHPEIKAHRAAWRLEYQREYRAKYPERFAEYARQYRARKFGATVGVITDEMLRAKRDYWNGSCWMCGREACEWDHLKPLAKGGLHTLANSRPACRNCNAQKSDIWPFDLTPYQDPFGMAEVPLDT